MQSHRHELSVEIYYCKDCDAYFSDGGIVNYESSDLVEYYSRYESAIRSRYRRVFAFVKTLVVSGKFLDIGAGMGYSLEVAQEYGWSVEGLEPNKVLAQHGNSRNLVIHNAYLNKETSGVFDFILIDNVLEHILWPKEFLENAVRLLAPSGVMLVAVPPMDWLRKGLGTFSCVRDYITVPQLNIFGEVDEHVNIFSRKAISRLLQNAGLRLLDVRFHHSLVYNNPLYRGIGLESGYYFAVKA